jgi:hypothetical protein
VRREPEEAVAAEMKEEVRPAPKAVVVGKPEAAVALLPGAWAAALEAGTSAYTLRLPRGAVAVGCQHAQAAERAVETSA